MARVVGRSRQVEEPAGGMKMSEMIVMAFLVAGIAAGGIYYWQSLQKAPHALSSFLSAVNRGRVKEQWDLIDPEDQAALVSSEKYEVNDSVPLGLGYAERIPHYRLAPEMPYPGHSDAVTIKATMDVVDGGGTKNLTDVAASHPYTDTFVMRKDKEGHWKVWLSETFKNAGGKLNLMQSAPSPRSTY